MKPQVIVFGGGCFWCVEAVFREVDGVLSVESGYSNGWVDNPTYRQVCEGDTGHAEVARIQFDPERVTLRELLAVFFATHDPTTLNRQGNDVGTQYRSGIYWTEPEQERVAKEFIAELTRERVFPAPIVTEVAALANYSKAEGYHERYFERNPYQGYCQVVIAPKLAKFRKQFADKLVRD